MSSAWCSYMCARTSSSVNLFWHPLQFDYVDIQSLAIPDQGFKFHEGIYHFVIQFCLNEWDTHRDPACVLLSTSGTQYSGQYKVVLTLEVPRGYYVSLDNILTFEGRALCSCSSRRHLP